MLYTLLTKNILKNYRISSKTIKNRSILINDVNSLLLVPVESQVIVFFEHSIALSYLKDLESALNLDITVVVNNDLDLQLTSRLFKSKLVTYSFIDGDLINSIILNDEKQLETLSTGMPPKIKTMSLAGLADEARKISVMSTGTEVTRLVASAFLNMLETVASNETELDKMREVMKEMEEKNLAFKTSLDGMSADMDDFLRTFKIIQAQIASRNVLDVVRDNNQFQLPSSITSLVIKNFGCPYLLRFIRALKDALTVSFDRYTKVVYIIEPDSASIQELNRSQFFLLTTETSASDILKNDMLLCVGNVKEPLEFLTSSSALDILIIVDCRRNTTELITGQTVSLYATQDLDTAINLGLDSQRTITASERSLYTLRESDFTSKRRHILRNNELVLRVANTLINGGI